MNCNIVRQDYLKWKYIRYHKDAQTAEDFIEKVAWGSKTSGQPYLVQTAEHEIFPLNLLFRNELKLLDSQFAKDRAAAALIVPVQRVESPVKEEAPQAENSLAQQMPSTHEKNV